MPAKMRQKTIQPKQPMHRTPKAFGFADLVLVRPPE